MRSGRRLLIAYSVGVLAFLALPIVIMVLFGFNDVRGRFNVTWQGFTLRWYRSLFAVPDLGPSLRNSIALAVTSALVSTVIGTMMAFALTRGTFRGRRWLSGLILAPIATPEIVMGASLLTMFVLAGVERGFLTIVFAHVMFSISYVTLTVRARRVGLDREWEDAARDLGATSFVAFRTVTLPLILPAVLTAAALAFALSIDDFVVTLFVSGQTVTFPLWVYGASRLGVPPQVNVMGTVLLAVTTVCAIVVRMRLRPKRTTPERLPSRN